MRSEDEEGEKKIRNMKNKFKVHLQLHWHIEFIFEVNHA